MRRLFAVAMVAIPPVAATAAQTDIAAPAQDLDCAIWASMAAGSTTDKDALLGIGTTMGYFVGRYEMAVGQDIDEAMMVRTPQITSDKLPELQQVCQARMRKFGERLVVLGQRMQALARELDSK